MVVDVPSGETVLALVVEYAFVVFWNWDGRTDVQLGEGPRLGLQAWLSSSLNPKLLLISSLDRKPIIVQKPSYLYGPSQF